MNNSDYIQQRIKNLISGRLNQDIEEQVAEAAQAVSEIDRVDSRKAYLSIQERLLKEQKYRLFINTLSRIAAILFIPLLIASGALLYRQLNFAENQNFAMQAISTPSGVRSNIILPDGSSAWLNAESTVKFKVPFDPTGREVILTGEAFFDVKKNPNVPFVVNIGNVIVRVSGTSFNCKAYEDETSIAVVLAEGKVSLNTDAGKTEKELIMRPNDRIVYDKTSGQSTITNEDINQFIAWHNGKLVFDETPMPEVANQLGRWFGVEVIINDPQINSYRLTTTFENESLHEILELIKLSSPIDIIYIPATIDKTKQSQTKSRVIFSKKIQAKN